MLENTDSDDDVPIHALFEHLELVATWAKLTAIWLWVFRSIHSVVR